MAKTKIVVTLEASLLRGVDALVRDHHFDNRSEVIEAALTEHLARLPRTRLSMALDNLDPANERLLAEEGLVGAPWPEY
ncbi:Ribbon-helix-helix protein, copG family [bacterium JGI 053]|nr:Ribbon-helix-helix protein, copG family [bacterium JGI 053]